MNDFSYRFAETGWKPTENSKTRLAEGFVTRVTEALRDDSIELGDASRNARLSAIRLFSHVYGDMLPSDISHDHVRKLISLLVNASLTGRDWRLQITLDPATLRIADNGLPKLSANSIRRHLMSLRTVWEQLYCDGLRDGNLRNPFAGHVLPKAEPWKNRGLSQFEIERTFSLPVFSEGDRPRGAKGEASYWVPLLLMFTGGSPEQICRLSIDDISLGENSIVDITFKSISIPSEARGTPKKLRTGRLLSCSRVFPLPPPLIKLGILDYIAWQSERGEPDLFPELVPKGPYDERFPAFELWWEGYLRSHGAFPKCCRAARAFKSTWITRAKQCEIGQEAQNYISGRGSNCNESEAVRLGKEIFKLNFDHCNLSYIQRWSPPNGLRVPRQHLCDRFTATVELARGTIFRAISRRAFH